jgi:hypothetical protein
VQSMQEGQTIKHEVYGLGVVTASDQERTAVDFDDHGPKLFVTSIMTAELIGEAPATPPKTKRRLHRSQGREEGCNSSSSDRCGRPRLSKHAHASFEALNKPPSRYGSGAFAFA